MDSKIALKSISLVKTLQDSAGFPPAASGRNCAGAFSTSTDSAFNKWTSTALRMMLLSAQCTGRPGHSGRSARHEIARRANDFLLSEGAETA